MNKNITRKLFLAATFLYWICLYLYVPTLPTYILTKTSVLAQVGTVLAMYGLWQAVLRIPVGIAVDKTGRGKLFIVTGLLIAGAGAVIMGTGKTIGVLTFGRALTGVGAATWVPLIAVFSKLYSPAQAVFATSLLTFSGSIGRMLSTSVNGLLNQAGGFPLAFYLAGFAAVLAASIMLFSKIQRWESKKVTYSSIFALFRSANVMLPALISLVGHFGTFAIIFGFMPVLAQQLGGSDIDKSLLTGLYVLALTIGNILNALIAKKARSTILLTGAVSLFTCGVLLMVFLKSLSLLYLATAIMGFADGFSYPTLMGLSIRDVEKERRSSAMGIHQSVYAIGMFGGPWIAGIIADRIGIQSMLAIYAGVVLVGTIALIQVYSRLVGLTPKEGVPSKAGS